MKERRELTGLRVDPSQVGPLAEVAAMACQSEVARSIGTAMFLRNDVLDMMGVHGILLRQQAILAAILSAVPDEIAEASVHCQEVEGSCLRALSLRIEIRSAA